LHQGRVWRAFALFLRARKGKGVLLTFCELLLALFPRSGLFAVFIKEDAMSAQLTRRTFLSGAAFASLGLMLAACAPAAPTAAPAKPAEAKPAAPAAPTAVPAKKEPVTIRFMCRAGADLNPIYQKSLDEDFTTKFPDIKVSLEPAPDGWTEKLLAAMVAGNAVDIFEAWGNIFYNWTDRGLLLDLQPFVDKDMKAEEIATYNDFQWTGLVMKGKRVGMPKYLNIMTMSINKDLYDKYGVKYPADDGNWNYDDYTNQMKALADAVKSKGDKTVWPGWLPMWSWDRFWGPIHSFGGKIVDKKDGKTCMMDSELTQQAMKWAYDISFKTNYHAQPSQMEKKWPGDTLAVGLIASGVDGTYPLSREKLWGEGAKMRWDMRHVPKGPTGKRSILGTTDAWSITKQSKNPQQAWEVTHFMAGPLYQKKVIAGAHGIIPVLKPLMKDFITMCREQKPRMKDVRLEVIDEIVQWGYAEDTPWFCSQVKATDLIIPALQKVFEVGDVGPEYFKEVSKQVNDGQKDCTA
jgi:ABC-type glycerol-3-phosphate transport system substrate-binding protein